MRKHLEELMVHQPHQHYEGEDGDSCADNPGGGCHQNFLFKGDINRRIEIPLFDGSDVSGWLVRIDCYIWIFGIPMGEKLEYVVLALHDEALMWFKSWESKSSFHTWLCFKQDLLKRFESGADFVAEGETDWLGYGLSLQFQISDKISPTLGGDTFMCMFHEGFQLTINLRWDGRF